ncbi:MAG: superoxide dismutase family protein [Kofleriaceae bacterium]|nr:MAG: superoxide dismutase family protein [Kofleriaceae bacterium]
MRSCFVVLAIGSLAACMSENRPPPAAASAPDHPASGAPARQPSEARSVRLFVDPGASELTWVREAVAVLTPTEGSDVAGVVRFRETRDGLDVFSVVDGLPPGRHAYHVHVYGDCTQREAKSAGPHFHFTGSSFDRGVRHITGNLGELRSDGDRAATHRTKLPAASLQGRFSIVGRAVVVHAQPNDPSQPPDGGAGDRLACGVVGISGDAWRNR